MGLDGWNGTYKVSDGIGIWGGAGVSMCFLFVSDEKISLFCHKRANPTITLSFVCFFVFLHGGNRLFLQCKF